MPKVILDVKLYSLKEVADMLGVTSPTVNKYIAEGKIEAILIGGRKYITEENLRKFLLNTD